MPGGRPCPALGEQRSRSGALRGTKESRERPPCSAPLPPEMRPQRDVLGWGAGTELGRCAGATARGNLSPCARRGWVLVDGLREADCLSGVQQGRGGPPGACSLLVLPAALKLYGHGEIREQNPNGVGIRGILHPTQAESFCSSHPVRTRAEKPPRAEPGELGESSHQNSTREGDAPAMPRAGRRYLRDAQPCARVRAALRAGAETGPGQSGGILGPLRRGGAALVPGARRRPVRLSPGRWAQRISPRLSARPASTSGAPRQSPAARWTRPSPAPFTGTRTGAALPALPRRSPEPSTAPRPAPPSGRAAPRTHRQRSLSSRGRSWRRCGPA